MRASPRLTTADYLRAINVTAWLYRDAAGVERIRVSPNIAIAELVAKFGPAATPDAEVGIHSEVQAAEWFRLNRGCPVLQIFSERIPCHEMCAPMLTNYFPGVPWYYYYDRSKWRGPGGGVVKTVAEVLKMAYGL